VVKSNTSKPLFRAIIDERYSIWTTSHIDQQPSPMFANDDCELKRYSPGLQAVIQKS
jgi:hypothetical protein